MATTTKLPSASKPGVLFVLTSVPDTKTARLLARGLVSRRLAACVTAIGPAESLYRWKGKVERAREKVLLIKTTRARYAVVEAFIRKTHPYELPEIAVIRIDKGSPEYLKWIQANTF